MVHITEKLRAIRNHHMRSNKGSLGSAVYDSQLAIDEILNLPSKAIAVETLKLIVTS